jgi:hypothetical protein
MSVHTVHVTAQFEGEGVRQYDLPVPATNPEEALNSVEHSLQAGYVTTAYNFGEALRFVAQLATEGAEPRTVRITPHEMKKDHSYLVTLQRKEHPGENFTVMVDGGGGRFDDEDTEAYAKDMVIGEIESLKLTSLFAGIVVATGAVDPDRIIEDEDDEANDYPDDLDFNPDHVTCVRLTAEEAAHAVTDCWWG